ncbi:hypothetical protein HMPREF1624_02514 [Sporothrix schenckii ATCC 58251]|uniref:RIC1 C-terminal alpha solenoid region domain-containing protein n=1 Tax=Sporothrix schenckii (strain ATCC 58251 / de Perez 2211183) TaxID=1391915 RepID=U7Q249_SPOS1|nr:hypothetical protein HMPREF1624_02514 [Sporothrix schenckii ATCC 58251]
MYWPAATPRVFSTSTSTDTEAAVPAVTISHDGLPPPPASGPSASPLLSQEQQSRRPSTLSADQPQLSRTASNTSQHSNHDSLGIPVPAASPRAPTTPLTPMTPAIKSVEHGYYGNDGFGDGFYPRRVSPLVVPSSEPILALRMSRTSQFFATITATSMTIWQTKPTVILAVIVRSEGSLASYGENVDLFVRPDCAILVVYTSRGFLITYSMATSRETEVYRPQFTNPTNIQRRRQNHVGDPGHDHPEQILWGPGEGPGIRDVSIRFRMVIKVDAGIESALALDDELVVATTKPAAVQCIRWAPDNNGSQTSTELLSRMGWLDKKATVREMIFDKPMSLSTWVTNDGKVYAVQRNTDSSSRSTTPANTTDAPSTIVPPPSASDPLDTPATITTTTTTASSTTSTTTDAPVATSASSSSSSSTHSTSSHKKLFRGYNLHHPNSDDEHAIRAIINARFSLIAVGCVDGIVRVYSVKDYVGSIPLSHTHVPPVSVLTTGRLTKMAYSPDGYCLFAGYENGWVTWSVYGKLLGHSFNSERAMADKNNEEWLTGIRDVSWVGQSGDVLLVAKESSAIWFLEMARSASAGCYSHSNLFRTVLHTNQNIMVYRGYDLPDMTSISAEPSLWHTARIPANYLLNQWPIRCAVISSDGRYVAVSGRRGLAHYSINSGRWRTFANKAAEDEFQVRGGMCWYRNTLIAAVEANRSFELRLYEREAILDNNNIVFREPMKSPIVLITTTGEDSLLVYTYENILYHYIFVPAANGSLRLMRMGHIGFHGIVRSPARVRGLSWVLPEGQLYDGDPSLDVSMASVLFLVDGKLVLFQPSRNEHGGIKYDMRIIAQTVEFYVCMKDQPFSFLPAAARETPVAPGSIDSDETLQNSLWLFDAGELKLWTDTHAALDAVANGTVQPPITIDLDFYPLSILLSKALVLGVEPDLVQRRDVNFSFFRYNIRTHLFLPDVLRAYLGENKALPALRLAQQYQHLAYFAHALEVLLHQVLDEEVDSAPKPEAAVLPRVLSLLSSFRAYHDIVVQCTRKTEVRSWRTLFAYLPPPQELFEESLLRGSLKTAGGYLLILHTFDALATASEQGVRLLRQAMQEGDWELCKELARFLAAMDDSGQTLKEAVALANTAGADDGEGSVASGHAGGPSSSLAATGASSRLAVPGRNSNTSQSESDAVSTSDDGNSIDSSTVSGH